MNAFEAAMITATLMAVACMILGAFVYEKGYNDGYDSVPDSYEYGYRKGYVEGLEFALNVMSEEPEKLEADGKSEKGFEKLDTAMNIDTELEKALEKEIQDGHLGN